MTKEELKEHCERQIECCEMWARQCGEKPHGKIYEEHKLILDLIKALEQQPYEEDVQRVVDYLLKPKSKPTSQDCVSRAEMLKYQQYLRGKMSNEENHKLWEFIKDLPPVTPTQGTCKDCTNYVVGALDEEICIRGHELIHKDFYCADYK